MEEIFGEDQRDDNRTYKMYSSYTTRLVGIYFTKTQKLNE